MFEDYVKMLLFKAFQFLVLSGAFFLAFALLSSVNAQNVYVFSEGDNANYNVNGVITEYSSGSADMLATNLRGSGAIVVNDQGELFYSNGGYIGGSEVYQITGNNSSNAFGGYDGVGQIAFGSDGTFYGVDPLYPGIVGSPLDESVSAPALHYVVQYPTQTYPYDNYTTPVAVAINQVGNIFVLNNPNFFFGGK